LYNILLSTTRDDSGIAKGRCGSNSRRPQREKHRSKKTFRKMGRDRKEKPRDRRGGKTWWEQE
jgi:hypothetical protein